MEQQLDLFGKNINYNIPKNKKMYYLCTIQKTQVKW